MSQERSLRFTSSGPARQQPGRSTPSGRTAQQSTEQRSRPQAKANQSLCSTCIHAPTCSYHQRSEGPVFFCEEFEVETGGLVTPETVDDRQSAQPLAGQRAQKAVPEYLGLCSNCAHRGACRLPKPEGGVWHCEEYS